MAATRAASFGGSNGASASASPGAGPRTASIFACVTTLSNTLMGVSVVGVAGGFARAGCAVGTCFLVLFACLSGSGLHLLARSSMTVSAAAKRREEAKAAEGGGAGKGGAFPPPSSFRAVALVGAPRWAFLIDVAVALKCFGVATSYLVVVGDLMPTAMTDILGESHADSFLRERRFWVTAGFFVAAPLAFSRTLGALKYTATLAIGLVVFLAGMVMSFWILPWLDACPSGDDDATQMSLDLSGNSEAVAQSAPTEGEDFTARGLLSSAVGGMMSPSPAVGGEGAGASENPPGFASYGFEGDDESCFEGPNVVGSVRTILQTLPIFVFCFTCHQNIFAICNEIVRPTPARVDAVIVCAMLVATATYLSLSWGAYATFGVGVDGDLLQTYPRTGLLTAARISVSILVLSCYPLQAHPSRLCILSTWKAFSADMQEAYSALAAADEEGGRQQGTQVDSSASSSPDSPLGCGGDGSGGGATGRIHPDILSNISSSSSSSSNSSPREARGGASLGAERGRRRVVSGARRIGVDTSRQESPERQAQREAELETLLSDAASPVRQLGEALGVDAPGSSGRGRLGDGDAGELAPSHRRTSSGTVDVESTDVAFSSTAVPGEKADDEEYAEEGAEGDGEAFWTSPEGFRHVLVTGAFLGLSYAIAMAVGDLGVLLEVVGATGSTTIAFILPGLLYLKVHPEPHPKRSLATLQLAVGLLIIPVALTFIALGESAEGRR